MLPLWPSSAFPSHLFLHHPHMGQGNFVLKECPLGCPLSPQCVYVFFFFEGLGRIQRHCGSHASSTLNLYLCAFCLDLPKLLSLCLVLQHQLSDGHLASSLAFALLHIQFLLFNLSTAGFQKLIFNRSFDFDNLPTYIQWDITQP